MGIITKPLGIKIRHQINGARLVCNHNLHTFLFTISYSGKKDLLQKSGKSFKRSFHIRKNNKKNLTLPAKRNIFRF